LLDVREDETTKKCTNGKFNQNTLLKVYPVSFILFLEYDWKTLPRDLKSSFFFFFEKKLFSNKKQKYFLP
jgi:hypothetical protein